MTCLARRLFDANVDDEQLMMAAAATAALLTRGNLFDDECILVYSHWHSTSTVLCCIENEEFSSSFRYTYLESIEDHGHF